MNEDADAVAVSLDLDLGDAGILQGLLQILTNVVVGDQGVAEDLVFCEPSGVPVLNDTHAKTVGIYFLSHLPLLLS